MGLSMATEVTDPSMEEYVQSLPKMHMEPLWSRMSAMVPPSPNPACQPYLWRYSDCLPYLSQAGSLVTETMAERRVLMLVNPAMSTYTLCSVTKLFVKHAANSTFRGTTYH